VPAVNWDEKKCKKKVLVRKKDTMKYKPNPNTPEYKKRMAGL
jgi:hypothetical protein